MPDFPAELNSDGHQLAKTSELVALTWSKVRGSSTYSEFPPSDTERFALLMHLLQSICALLPIRDGAFAPSAQRCSGHVTFFFHFL